MNAALCAYLATITTINAAPANDNLARPKHDEFKVIDHDKLVFINPNATDIEHAWQPILHVRWTSCVPFPAVDKDGAVTGGLKPTGPDDGNCDKSIGQCYVRATTVHDPPPAVSQISSGSASHDDEATPAMQAFMYSWYMVNLTPSPR